MRAIQIMAPGDARVVDVPEPEVDDGEVLVKISACVTCPHWDTTLFRGIDIFDRPGHPEYPIPAGFPGHEVSGEVVAAGPKVRDLAVGDRVATLETAGTTVPGFYAEYIARPEGTVTRIPDNTSYAAGASMEMARYVAAHIHVIEVGGLRTGVVGLGPAGLMALQMFRAMGASEVVAIDILPSRLELAAELGATETIDASAGGDTTALAEQPLAASVDCTGAEAGMQLALDHTHGPVVPFGVTHGNPSFSTRHWLQRTWIPRRESPGKEATEFVLDLWGRGLLDTEKFISARLPFERYVEGVQLLLDRQAIRVLFHP